MHRPHHFPKAICLMLAGWLFFTIVATLTRLSAEEISIPMILFFQNLISLVCILPWMLKHGKESFKTQKPILITVRAVSALFGFGFLFLAVQKISLVNAMLLNNAGPIFIPLLARLWIKAPINHKLWPAIFIGFIGIACILHPTTKVFNPGFIYGLGSAISLAIGLLATRLLTATEKGHTILFYLFLVGTLLSLPLCLIYWTPLTLHLIFYLLAIGILTALGQFAFLNATHFAKASLLGPFCYSAVIYAALIQWYLWGVLPDSLTITGVILVCLGGILTITLGRPPKEPLIKN